MACTLPRASALTTRVQVTLIDRRNFHLFQPLLYQVATGALSPGEIAQPLRSILRRKQNTTVLLGEARQDRPGRASIVLADGGAIDYDTLVVATGARFSYFGHDAWAPFAPGLKSIDDAIEIRRRILIAFEAAEREADPVRRAEWMTFVVVGGGPTGVELAGAIGEIANDTLRRDFRAIRPQEAVILLVEALDRILPTYPIGASVSARRQLERLGVRVRTVTRVVDVGDRHVTLDPVAPPRTPLPHRARSMPTPPPRRSPRGRSCGRRACSRRPSPGRSPLPRAPRPTAPAGSASRPT